MGVSKNNGTSKSCILIGVSMINHPFWGIPIFGNTHMMFFSINSNAVVGRHCQTLRIFMFITGYTGMSILALGQPVGIFSAGISLE